MKSLCPDSETTSVTRKISDGGIYSLEGDVGSSDDGNPSSGDELIVDVNGW